MGTTLSAGGIIKNMEKFPVRARNTVESGLNEEKAREVLGEDFYGLQELKEAGLKFKNSPKIPFTLDQLEKAKDRGMTLMFFSDALPNGSPLTAKSLIEYLDNTLGDYSHDQNLPSRLFSGKRTIPFVNWNYKEDEDPVFAKETPATGWRLLSKEPIHGMQTTYFADLNELSTYVTSLYDSEEAVPPATREALEEFKSLWTDQSFQQKVKDSENNPALDREVASTLTNLKLAEMFQESLPESIYRMIVEAKTKKENFPFRSSFTKSLGQDGRLVISRSNKARPIHGGRTSQSVGYEGIQYGTDRVIGQQGLFFSAKSL